MKKYKSISEMFEASNEEKLKKLEAKVDAIKVKAQALQDRKDKLETQLEKVIAQIVKLDPNHHHRDTDIGDLMI